MSSNETSLCRKDASEPIARHASVKSDVTNVTTWERFPIRENACDETTLVNEVAHDFKNILYVIRGFTELVRDVVPKDTNSHRHLTMVLDAADQGARLVGQMLTRSRQGGPQKHPIDIRPIVEETVGFIRSSLPEGVSVRLTMSEDMRPVLADPTQIHQLLMNLCANAAHSMRDEGGVLHVELGRVELGAGATALHPDLETGPYLRLTVSDTGSGMDPHVAKRIFEPYFTTKKAGQGTGLGLTVVQRIVKSHGGAITVHSAVGKGTTCRAFFPTVECASPICSLRRTASFTSARKGFDMGLLREDLQHLRNDMEHIHGDIEHLEKDLEEIRLGLGSHVFDLKTHVRDLDAHIHDVLSHVMHIEEHTWPVETAQEATMQG